MRDRLEIILMNFNVYLRFLPKCSLHLNIVLEMIIIFLLIKSYLSNQLCAY